MLSFVYGFIDLYAPSQALVACIVCMKVDGIASRI